MSDFWRHLQQKNRPDQLRRIKFYPCAIDLIRHNTFDSQVSQNPSKSLEILHRFYGYTKDGALFCVQVKENKKTNRKDFMSVFPIKDSGN